MLKSIYLKLAVSSIRRNAQTYLPYLAAGIGMVAMFYIMLFLGHNGGLASMPGRDTLQQLLTFGAVVVGLFGVIFLFYTHNFLIRRRKKELGLYNVLGMEKAHIARIITWEALLTALASIGVGLGAGVLTSKLMLLVLVRILGFPAPIGFEIPGTAVTTTLQLFAVLFAAILVNSLRQVRSVQPIELLKESSIGEREPKARWFLAVLGFISLGIGYFLALTITHPLDALVYFFVAVIFVIVGTYLLFVVGSIALLKLLRRKKGLYYRPTPFIAISGMLHRMKQNAVGLANICILSTMVLVTLSTTTSLYVGIEEVLQIRYPREIVITAAGYGDEGIQWVKAETEAVLAGYGVSPAEVAEYRFFALPVFQYGSRFAADIEAEQGFSGSTFSLNLTPLEDYNRIAPEPVSLKEDEVLVYSNRGLYDHSVLEILGKRFTVKESLREFPARGLSMTEVFGSYYVVVRDMNVLEELRAAFAQTGSSRAQARYQLGFDLNTDHDQAVAVYHDLKSALRKNDEVFIGIQSREEARNDFFSLYGGLFFLGLFLGLVFIMGTVLIIYYKQITEGFEDRQRYVIMQQVGMGKDEVRNAIKSQVLAVFFLPLAVAAMHVAGAFKMITKLLTVFNLTNVPLFAACTLGTFLAFAALYALVYRATAKVYYRIVTPGDQGWRE
ncbi:MAG TPA: FtsX-like permease family protein [Firmicutes bacterium]|jgi:putative ABC transport system permease protein|nr:FtsX-like permease family protein [Bacillota bacterium]